MSSREFIDGKTVITADWLNDVNRKTYHETINVKNFGATGDGTTNDLPSIQAAHDAVFEAGGGTVFFPQGVYLVRGSILFKDNVSFIGAGRGATIIKLSNGAGVTRSHGIIEPAGTGNKSAYARGYYSKNNYFAHFSIDGNISNNGGSAYGGLLAGFVKDCVVEDVESYRCGEVGFQGQISNEGPDRNSLISFINCIAHDNVADGFQVHGATLTNCWAYKNGGSGINSVGNYVYELDGVSDIVTQIINCRADNNAQGGITCSQQQGPPIRTIISNCSTHRNGTNGIFAGMDYTSISNCDVQFNSQDGISVAANYVNIFGGNSNNNGKANGGTFNHKSGILLIGTKKYCLISGVICTDFQTNKTQQFGIALMPSVPFVPGSNNLISNCILSGNSSTGIYNSQSASDYTITNNVGS